MIASTFARLALACFALSALAGGCTSSGGAAREDTPTACANGLDDDGDGLVDCAETTCLVHTTCGGPGPGVDGGGVGPGVDARVPVDANYGDVPPALCIDPIDVVFVLDVSTSMSGEAGALRSGIGSIFDAADALTPDHTFGLVVFVDDELVVSSCSSFPTASNLQDEFSEWRDFCSSNHNPDGSGANSDCAENSLDAIYAATTECPWRTGATHILIHVTDDTFEEPPYEFSGEVRAEHDYAEVVDALVAAQVRVGAFAMEVPEECGAGTSGNTGRGFFTPFDGMPSLPEATGGRVWDIADVRSGTLDMATLINEMIEDEHCTVF